jgi:hypothetical protein
MSEREEVIHEVRKLIKDGATIPKCLRFICKKLDVSTMAAVDYLRSAFCLGPSMIHKATGGFQRVDADNTQRGLATFLVLPMIVQHRQDWDDRETENLSNWFDSLACSSSQCIAEKALASIRDDKDWANVPPAVREQYLTAERSRLVLYEYSEIISRLAERLQLRIDELEDAGS